MLNKLLRSTSVHLIPGIIINHEVVIKITFSGLKVSTADIYSFDFGFSGWIQQYRFTISNLIDENSPTIYFVV